MARKKRQYLQSEQAKEPVSAMLPSVWETAIYAHTAGLASGYGGYLTYAMAQKYCPPNSSAWYSSVAANMAMI